MQSPNDYLMENEDEEKRLDIKTDREAVKVQASWCGIKPGSRILDAGCGAGNTTSVLHSVSQPGGEAIGVDFVEKRILYAQEHYGNKPGIDFYVRDIRFPMKDLGQFDFIWIRFVMEYYRLGAIDIIKNITDCLKPDGVLCLIDLDHNCLSHWELPVGMESTLIRIMHNIEEQYNFDLYAGRKLYSYLYDLGFQDIKIHLMSHHLIYGDLRYQDAFNWRKKLEIGSLKANDAFENYPGGFDAYLDEFNKFFEDPRRFTYTPLIICKGRKPCI